MRIWRFSAGDGAALTLSYTNTYRVTLCATDDVAARLEDLQDVLGEGRGPTAYLTGAITVADLHTDDGPWVKSWMIRRLAPDLRGVLVW